MRGGGGRKSGAWIEQCKRNSKSMVNICKTLYDIDICCICTCRYTLYIHVDT